MSDLLAARGLAALLDATARTLVLFLAAGVAILLLRRASAATRHLVWLLTLTGLLFLPLLSAALPGWRVALWPAGLFEEVLVPEMGTQPWKLAGGALGVVRSGDPTVRSARVRSHFQSSSLLPPTGTLGGTRREQAPSPTAGASSRTPHGPAVHGESDSSLRRRVHSERTPRAVSLLEWVFLLWLAVGAALLTRAMTGLAQLWRIGRRCRPVTAAPVLSLAAELARELEVRRPVRLLHGLLDGPPAMPMTWGFRQPVVLLPTGFAGWPEHRQRAILLHELAHVKRGDWLVQLLSQGVCAVYWFHPLAWWAARRLRVESERACDDHVLTAGVRASDYATHLLEVVRMMKAIRVSPRAAVALVHRPLIEERLRAILEARGSRGALPARARAVAAAGAAALLLPLAAVHGAAQAPAARVAPIVQRVKSIPAHAARVQAVASVEITPLATPRMSHTAVQTARLAAPSRGEPQPTPQPTPEPRPAGRVSDGTPVIAPPPAAPPATHDEERSGNDRSEDAVLAVDSEVRSAVVLAGAAASSGLVLAANENEDRSDAKGKEPNLAEKDLSGADLSGRDLSGKDLSGKDLSGANLSGAKLRNANLAKTDLSGANLANADLSRASAKGADMSGANLTGANLSGVDLSGADLSGANLSRVNVADVKLVHADLSGTNLKGINLAGRDLSGADFSGADLSGSRLADANLTKADLSGANLGNADLSHARLKDADLSGANLDGTNLRDTDLAGADVSGTKLEKSKPE